MLVSISFILTVSLIVILIKLTSLRDVLRKIYIHQMVNLMNNHYGSSQFKIRNHVGWLVVSLSHGSNGTRVTFR